MGAGLEEGQRDERMDVDGLFVVFVLSLSKLERKSSMAMWLVKGGQASLPKAPRLARMPARVVS